MKTTKEKQIDRLKKIQYGLSCFQAKFRMAGDVYGLASADIMREACDEALAAERYGRRNQLKGKS